MNTKNRSSANLSIVSIIATPLPKVHPLDPSFANSCDKGAKCISHYPMSAIYEEPVSKPSGTVTRTDSNKDLSSSWKQKGVQYISLSIK